MHVCVRVCVCVCVCVCVRVTRNIMVCVCVYMYYHAISENYSVLEMYGLHGTLLCVKVTNHSTNAI
jgi:hypothetical protein